MRSVDEVLEAIRMVSEQHDRIYNLQGDKYIPIPHHVQLAYMQGALWALYWLVRMPADWRLGNARGVLKLDEQEKGR